MARSKPRNMAPHRAAEAIALMDEGMSRRLIAERMSVSISTVDTYLSHARLIRSAGGSLSARAVVSRLPDEVRAWLIGQVPEGSTLDDMIRAILVDAYNEEIGS